MGQPVSVATVPVGLVGDDEALVVVFDVVLEDELDDSVADALVDPWGALVVDVAAAVLVGDDVLMWLRHHPQRRPSKPRSSALVSG